MERNREANAHEDEDVRPIELYVLVIAHPDDESMFFVPWLMHMAHRKAQARSRADDVEIVLWLVCLTTGNYDGLGPTRCIELQTVAATVLPVIDKVVVMNESTLPDHPTEAWDIATASTLLQQALRQALCDEHSVNATTTMEIPRQRRPMCMQLVTFDQGGVSGHVNHRDTYFAVRHLYLQQTFSTLSTKHVHCQTVSLWTLESIDNPVVKYLPVGEWLRFLWYWLGCSLLGVGTRAARATVVNDMEFRLSRPWINWHAMATHRSQFVWYRRLFVVFSCYTYWNKMRVQHCDMDTRQCEFNDTSAVNVR